MFGQDREQLRRFFRSSWDKRLAGEPLQPLEQLVAQVVEQHPEYHRHLKAEDDLKVDYPTDAGEPNPWLHMGMHITLGEQLAADRPAGLRPAYQRIVAKIGDRHAAEHAMMECLGMALWTAQRDGEQPDEQSYLACLERIGR